MIWLLVLLASRCDFWHCEIVYIRRECALN